MVLRRGYIVAEWGDIKRVDMTFSVTKSFLSTVTGLAWDRGLIHDLADPVKDLVYVSPDHDLVVVVRWLERRGRDEFFRRVLEAVRS